MQVSQQSINEGSLAIEVKIEKADFESKVNKELKTFQQKASMPGFRPGKVPFGMVKKMYGGQILADQVNKTVSEGLNNYLTENKVNILGHPMPDFQRTGTLDLENGNEFSFFFNVLLTPEFDVKLEEMSFDYPKVMVSDDELNQTISKIIEENPETTYPETVGEKDVVELKAAQAGADENEVDGGYQTKVVISMEDIADDEIKNLLLGKELGSEFLFNFAKALGDKEKAAKRLRLAEEQKHLAEETFNVVLDEIRGEAPGALNEQLFDRIFPNDTFESEAAFREKIRTVMSEQWDSQSNYFVYSLALKKLVDETPMKFDDELLKQWLLEVEQQKLTADQLEEQFDDYVKSLRFQLIEEQLLGKYPELSISRDDVRQYVANFYIRQYGMGLGDGMDSLIDSLTDSILKDKKEAERIHNQIRETKLVKLFREKLQLKEVFMSSEEFKDLMKSKEENPQNEEIEKSNK